MGIVAHLRQISANEVVAFTSSPAEAFRLFQGGSPRVTPHMRTIAARMRELSTGYYASGVPQRLSELGGRVEDLDVADRDLHQAYCDEIGRLGDEHRAASDSAPGLDLDKSFHVIHYLLTGKEAGGEPPLAKAILGARELRNPRRSSDTSIRIVTPAEVAAISRALAGLSAEQLLARYDPREMNRRNVYGVSADEEEPESIRHYYERLRSYYADAARNANGMLIYMG